MEGSQPIKPPPPPPLGTPLVTLNFAKKKSYHIKLTLLEAAKSLSFELNDPLGISQPYYRADRLKCLQNISLRHIIVLVNHKMRLWTLNDYRSSKLG